MAINAREIPGGGGGKRPDPMGAGTYPARLVQVLTLGVQEQREFKGEAKPPRLELMLTYEFLDEFLKNDEGEDLLDKPRWLSETIPLYNLEADLAKSTKRYLALDPKLVFDGEWDMLLGTPCMVEVVVEQSKKDKKIYENIGNVSPMREKEAAKAPKLVNPTKLFNFYEPDTEVFEKLPQWLRDKIKGALDFEGSALQEALEGAPRASTRAVKGAQAEAEPEEGDEEENW